MIIFNLFLPLCILSINSFSSLSSMSNLSSYDLNRSLFRVFFYPASEPPYVSLRGFQITCENRCIFIYFVHFFFLWKTITVGTSKPYSANFRFWLTHRSVLSSLSWFLVILFGITSKFDWMPNGNIACKNRQYYHSLGQWLVNHIVHGSNLANFLIL